MKKIIILALLLFLVQCQEKKQEGSQASEAGESLSENTPDNLIGEGNPIANPKAVKGGTLTKWGSLFPKSLNYFLDLWHISAEITQLQFEPMISMHSVTNNFVGVIAESWEIAEDSLTFTFKIRKEAQWSDGTPITANDIQFFYDVIMDPKNLTPVFRVGLKRFERPVVQDEHTLVIKAKERHWSNFNEAGGMFAFPKHIWKDLNFNEQKFNFPVVSGPYKIKDLKKGRSVLMERRKDWWGRVLKYNQYQYNFDFLKYKFMDDQNKVLEALKKGDLDVYAVYTSKIWMKQTDFPAVQKGWVAKRQIYNKEPKGFQGMAFNMRKEKFKDVRVRRALFHMLDRAKMNEKLMYNVYFLMDSYFPDLYPNNDNPDVELVGFDPDKARGLLKEAGWKVNKKGLLKKGGEGFKITFYTTNPDHRHLNVYVEDLKSIGIQGAVQKISKSTLTKRLDDKDFDMHWQAFGAGRLRDPESQWHSDGANKKASHNYPGVADPFIDSLIEAQKTIMDVDIRNDILRAIDKRLDEILPFALLWQSEYARLLYWNKFGTPKHVLDKYNREDIIVQYWWLDKEKEAILNKAKMKDEALEKLPLKVHYTE